MHSEQRELNSGQREFEAACRRALPLLVSEELFARSPEPGSTYKNSRIEDVWFGWTLARKKGPCVVDGPCLLKTP